MKYEFTGETKQCGSIMLQRIRLLIDIPNIGKAGDVGGWIEKESNLSQNDNAMVSGNAEVYGNAWVFGNAEWLLIGPIGSRKAFTTFYNTKVGEIGVTCGCFVGNINAFAEQVEKEHGDNEHGVAYRAAIELAKVLIKTRASV